MTIIHRSLLLLAILGLLLGMPARAAAIFELEVEEEIADLLPNTLPRFFSPEMPFSRLSGVLPQVGYGPDTGLLGGIKIVQRNLYNRGITADAEATFAAEGQQAYNLSVATPDLMNDRLIIVLRTRYRLDLMREFFGVGNSDIEPGRISVYAFEEMAGALTIGWRVFERMAFNFGIGVRNLDIWCDPKSDGKPCTLQAYPDLPGIYGGLVNYLKFSVVWNNRDDIFRPTRGWRLIFKIIHTNKEVLSNFTFTRIAADAGYLRSFFSRRLVFGMRLNFQWITGPEKDIPFWELTQLGGSDSLRGYYPHRFLGKGMVLLNSECRFYLGEFPFFDIWQVRVDGVLFGDGGRVFISQREVEDEFDLNSDFVKKLFDAPRYSYGAGLRVALSDSFLARIDVGFSDEEKGLVYLSFGHTF